MNKVLRALKFKQLASGFSYTNRFGLRTFLSQAYHCEDAWNKRLDLPILSSLKTDYHFVETDKKFNNNKPIDAVDIDLFANAIQEESQLEELEHLLYRFRKTKYTVDMMDSTVYATMKIYQKFKDYESLLHILHNQDAYGIFPDFYCYNSLMDTFIKENKFKEATQVAILMMLQEDFSNEISRYLALYSCQKFLKEYPIESLYPEKVELSEKKEEVDEDDDDYEQETFIRVPHLRNPFFDDHFQLTNPQHLIGKTFFLVGREMNKDILGQTYHLLGLGMYEKWNMALDFLNSVSKLEGDILLSEGVDEFKKYMNTITDEELKKQIEESLDKMHRNNKTKAGELEHHLKLKLENLPSLEKQDIEDQLKLFSMWNEERELACKRQKLILEKARRLEEVAKKKEYLFWKEKSLFFFENEMKLLNEYGKAKEATELEKAKEAKVDTYVPPEKLTVPTLPPTKYERLANVKKLD